MNRRTALATFLALAAGPALAAKVNDDGLHVQDWFLHSFLDLRDDLKESQEAGKRLVVVFEQKGCVYCRDMHEVNLAIPKINDYIRAHFNVVQLNLFGSREVTDFDGKVHAEKDLAKRWGVVFTPTLVFLPPTLAEAQGKSGRDAEVARMPGYFRPLTFIGMFRFVKEQRYKDLHFQKYYGEIFDELKAAGYGGATN